MKKQKKTNNINILTTKQKSNKNKGNNLVLNMQTFDRHNVLIRSETREKT